MRSTDSITATERLATKPPSRLLQLLEGRALFEFGATLSAWPLLSTARRGDGHPVLVLPGLIASDVSTGVLRRYLRERGYHVHGWKMGRNLGLRSGVEDAMQKRLDDLHARHGQKISLVGWSLGGLYARALGKHRPDAVRNVITLGSPITGSPRATNAWRVYQFASGHRPSEAETHERLGGALAVPSTSIYSRTDGIVGWRTSVNALGPTSENIEVVASHLGLGVHPAVLFAVADRLAQPEGAWKPFDRSGIRALAYPDPLRR